MHEAPVDKPLRRESLFHRIFGGPGDKQTLKESLAAFPIHDFVTHDSCPTSVTNRINVIDASERTSCRDVIFANSMYVAVALSNKQIQLVNAETGNPGRRITVSGDITRLTQSSRVE